MVWFGDRQRMMHFWFFSSDKGCEMGVLDIRRAHVKVVVVFGLVEFKYCEELMHVPKLVLIIDFTITRNEKLIFSYCSHH